MTNGWLSLLGNASRSAQEQVKFGGVNRVECYPAVEVPLGPEP